MWGDGAQAKRATVYSADGGAAHGPGSGPPPGNSTSRQLRQDSNHEVRVRPDGNLMLRDPATVAHHPTDMYGHLLCSLFARPG